MPSDRAYTEQGKQWAPGQFSVSATAEHAVDPLFKGDKQRPVQVAGNDLSPTLKHFTPVILKPRLGCRKPLATNVWPYTSRVCHGLSLKSIE